MLCVRDTNYQHRHAQKILRAIQRETNSLKRAPPAEITEAKWKSLDEAMSQYVTVIRADSLTRTPREAR